MRQAEPLEPEVAAALEAIDAALHDEPVDPELADLAELSLILRDDRPEPHPAWESRLDQRVSRRFADPEQNARRSSRRQWWGIGSALTAVAVVAIALVVVLPRGSGTSSNSSTGVSAGAAHAVAKSESSTTAASSAGSGAASSAVGTSTAGATTTSSVASAPAPAPRSPAGRQVAQSAHLSLSAGAGRIEGVAQQVFNVIAAEHGFVAGSHVNAVHAGTSYATFALRVPSGRLQGTLNRLSHLRHARVLARSDSSADITAGVRSAGDRLSQDRAYHRSLLRQLSGASTTLQADRIQARLRRNNAAILRDQDALQGLHRRVADSRISVSIQAPAAVAHHHHKSGGTPFTIGRALHDAGHVLVVAAGVALIALAALVPAGLLAAFAAWVWAIARHRRRESTLGP